MKTKVSYSIELKGINRMIEPTVRLFRSAVTYLIKVYEKEYDELTSVSTDKRQRFYLAEKLIHNTVQNTAKYDFDTHFYKMPSYMRRAAIQIALGICDSYKTNYQDWLDNDSKGKTPKLTYHHLVMPTFYDSNMSKGDPNDPYTIYLKLYIDNDYKFIPIKLKKTDKDYLLRHYSGYKCSCPTLEKRYGKYYLRFCLEIDAPLRSSDIDDRRICAVDLGINKAAVLSIMEADGTVLARRFIDLPNEKDHLYHLLNRIKRYQKEGKSVTKLWRYIKHSNDEMAYKTADAIIKIALAYDVDVIVFEHLDIKGKKKGSKRQKLQMWKKNTIQNVVTHKAHREGMRIAHINPKYTSALAYDGSGQVKRDQDNYGLCTFESGKHYHSDLNASYNIGARYFIREILKTFSEKRRSQVEAEVPLLMKRTSCTLSTLWQLNALR